eukprot:jgi/Mesvir1/3880/Mv19834-RA.1
MDPLTLLREYTSSKRLGEVALLGDTLCFGNEIAFNKDAPTSYMGTATKSFYTLAAVWYCVKYAEANEAGFQYTAYLRDAKKDNIPPVSLVDRRNLLQYLRGEVDATDAIQADAPVPAPVPLPKKPEDTPSAPEREPARVEPAEPPEAKKARLDVAADKGEGDVAGITVPKSPTSLIMERESSLLDRTSMLLTPKKNLERVLKLADEKPPPVKKPADDDRRAHGGGKEGGGGKGPAPADRRLPVAGQGRHRYGEEEEGQFWKSYLRTNDAEDLGIDTLGGFGNRKPDAHAAAPIAPAPASASGPRPAPPSRVLTAPPHASHNDRHAAAIQASSGAKKGHPIIVVPPYYASMINMLNAKEFLEEGRFVPWQQLEPAGAAQAKASSMLIKRSIGRNREVTYQVTDNVTGLQKEQWKLVVGIVTAGKEWQFKGWPWFKDGGIVEVFRRARGFFFRFDDDKMSDSTKVRAWNVLVMTIYRNTRHRDHSSAMEFWQEIDKSVGCLYPKMVPNVDY